MKRIAIILASLFVLFSTTDALASGFVVKGGVNFPHIDIKDITNISMKASTGWHAGFGYQTGSAAGFSFQPELLYTRNGINVSDTETAETVHTNMIQLVPNVQWGIDLLVCKPFVFVAPYVGVNVSTIGSNSTAMKNLIDNAKKLDYGLGLGLGINVWKVQITGKYNWQFGNILNWEEYKASLKDIKMNNGAFVLSAAFVF